MSLVVVESIYCLLNWTFISLLSGFVSLICFVDEEASGPGKPAPPGYRLPTGNSVRRQSLKPKPVPEYFR